jgi:hypoxanthine phosphoribosyltransferase
MKKNIKEILIKEQDIQDRVLEIAQQISSDYDGKDLLIVCVLKGASVFFAHLVKSISVPLEIDFISVSSYGHSTQSSGVVRFVKDLEMEIEDKDVLIVEDIVDTGLTLKYLIDNFSSRKARTIKVCTLLDKPERRKNDVVMDYVGFIVPDEFIVGFGIDYAEKYRNLPYIATLKEEAYK